MSGNNIIKPEDKGGFAHFMLKEIYQQPEVIRCTLNHRIAEGKVVFPQLDIGSNEIKRIFIVACGTAYHAGLVGKLAIEKLARIPVEVEIASEFRYRDILWQPGDYMIVISQSGETNDTLGALDQAKQQGIKTLAIVNVEGSTMAKEADQVIYTNAGAEIAIASTKAYSAQLVIMYLLAIYFAQQKEVHPQGDLARMVAKLLEIDKEAEKVLKQEQKIKEIARKHHNTGSAFYLGRSLDYAVAMEGALKLKETSYVHAEAYASGEFRHGPIALIGNGLPVVGVICQKDIMEKTISNLQEIKERGGKTVAICLESMQEACRGFDDQILLPDVDSMLAPLVAVIPLQIFAYYMALFRGNDVDQPRNLTKAVVSE